MTDPANHVRPLRLFVSYARADRARIVPLTQALSAAGLTVWWDQLIDGGAAFAKTIEAELEGADAVIAAWSAGAIASDWVRDEAGHGRDRHRLVPITLDGSEPPLGFRQYHAIDFSRWNGRADAPEFASLLRGIEAAATGGVPAAPAIAAASRPSTSRRSVMVGGGLAAAIAGAGGLALWRPWEGGGRSNSVAVLPFANLSGDPQQSYFSDGLAEEIRSALALNPALKVAAPTSSIEMSEKRADLKSVAAALGVAFVLDGSIRKADDVIRVVATLSDAATGFTSWTQTFDRKMADILAVQGEIAATVEDALSVRVTGEDSGNDRGRGDGGTENVAAYDAYLQGRALFDSDAGETSDRGALAKFDAAIALDPEYANAHAARSRTLAAIAAQYGKGSDLRAQYQLAIAAARRATELAPRLARGHLALGYATFNGTMNARAARQSYDRAAEYGKGDADVLVLVAHFQSRTGRGDEAIATIRRAEALDPINPRTFRAEASILNGARRYAEAAKVAQRALKMAPDLGGLHSSVGFALLGLGKPSEAKAEFTAEPLESVRLAGLAIADHRLGNAAAARDALAKLVDAFGDGAAYQQAQVYAQFGDKDNAVDALSRAYAANDAGLTTMGIDAMLDPIRQDPRFVELLGKLGMT